MPYLTDATKERQRRERRKNMTLQERMMDDHNKQLKREANKRSLSVQDAEKTAEKIVDTPKDGFLDDYIDPGSDVSSIYDAIKEGVTNISGDIKQWWEKDDVGSAASNMERIMSEGGDYSEQTFPTPPRTFREEEAKEDWAFQNEKHRKRLAAQKNNISNTQHKNMLEKNLSKRQQRNLERFGKPDLGLNLSRLTGKNVDATNEEIGISAEKVAEHEKKRALEAQGERGHWSEGSAYDYPERGERGHWSEGDAYDMEKKVAPETVVTPTETVVPKQEGIMSVGEGDRIDRYSSYPQGREFEKMDYEDEGPQEGGPHPFASNQEPEFTTSNFPGRKGFLGSNFGKKKDVSVGTSGGIAERGTGSNKFDPNPELGLGESRISRIGKNPARLPISGALRDRTSLQRRRDDVLEKRKLIADKKRALEQNKLEQKQMTDEILAKRQRKQLEDLVSGIDLN